MAKKRAGRKRTVKLQDLVTARVVAAESWSEADGDREAAEQIFRQKMVLKGLDPATILLLLKILVDLFIYWQSSKTKRPNASVQEGEPPLNLAIED